jgi:hypothetical protein
MRVPRFVAPVLALLLAGCQAFVGPLACTDVGCPNGLTVRFDRPPAGAYRIEVVPDHDPALARTLDCPAAEMCGPAAFVGDFFAESVTLRVTTAAGTTTRQVRPRFQPVYPNGRRCGAACSQAEVTVRLP